MKFTFLYHLPAWWPHVYPWAVHGHRPPIVSWRPLPNPAWTPKP